MSDNVIPANHIAAAQAAKMSESERSGSDSITKIHYATPDGRGLHCRCPLARIAGDIASTAFTWNTRLAARRLRAPGKNRRDDGVQRRAVQRDNSAFCDVAEKAAATAGYGTSTVRLIQRMLSQLNAFSVPSNNFA
jgi:hypothetical protein